MPGSNYSRFVIDLGRALPTFNSVANSLNLPDVVRQHSLNLFRRVIMKGISKARRRSVLVGSCIIISSSLLNYPIKITDVSKASDCSKRDLIRNKKFIDKHLMITGEGFTAESFINRFCCELGISERDKSKIISESTKISKFLPNKPAILVAVVCIYLNSSFSMRRLAKISSLSVSAIYNAKKSVMF